MDLTTLYNQIKIFTHFPTKPLYSIFIEIVLKYENKMKYDNQQLYRPTLD